MIRQAFADVIVAPQGRNTRNVLHRALDELDLLSLQLRPDISTSNESGASSQSHQSDSLQNARRNRSEPTVIRNVCDRLGLSPPSSPSLGRRIEAGQSGSANSASSRRRIAQHGKFAAGRSLALDTLDLEVGLRRRTCAKVLSRPRYQRAAVESSCKLLPGDTNDTSQTSCSSATSTRASYTPLSDRQSRKRMERCKRLRKPYDLPWRAQKSATLNTLFADVDGVSRRTDAGAYVSQSHARRVSAPSVLDTDDECATPTQSQPGTTSQGSSNGTRLNVRSTIESVAEAPTPTGSQFASPTSNMQVGESAYRSFAESRTAESLMIGDAPETVADGELAETETHTQAETGTSGAHSLGLISTTTLSVCNAFTSYAQTAFDAAPSVPDCFISSRSQSNSVDSKSPAVSSALAPSNASSQCLSRSRSLDTVGIGAAGACTLDPSDPAHYHAAAHAHFHSSHASYVSQAHSPHTTFTLGSDSLAGQPGVFASCATGTFAYPAPPPAGHHPRTLSAHVGQFQPQNSTPAPAPRDAVANVHNYTHYWRTAGQPQTSAGVLDSSAPRPTASLSQQAALQKYGVEDLMAHSMRHLRLNDR